jgi:hypothetical protein
MDTSTTSLRVAPIGLGISYGSMARTIRITNVRVNASGIGSSSNSLTHVGAFV